MPIKNDWHRLIIWLVICGALVALLLTLLAANAHAEYCYSSPGRTVERNIEKKGGYAWRRRQVDGKRCWYYARGPLPQTDLVWSFSEEEFNSDVDRVLERKFYDPSLEHWD